MRAYMGEDLMPVEVAYARPDEQRIFVLNVSTDATVRQVIEQSGVLHHYPEIDLSVNKVGVFSKLTKLDANLYPGDRVEIYRQLLADPKEARKKRAAEGKTMKKGTVAK